MSQAKRVLFLTSNPSATARLNLEIEMREVKSAVQRAVHRDRFHVELCPAIQLETLQEVLDQSKPAIVHFAGHGDQNREELVFADRNDRPRQVDIFVMAKMLERCEGVVLNACCSARQAEAIAGRGPWAIGTTAPILDTEAVTFARTLYGKLANGCELEEAFRGAALQVAAEGCPGSERLAQLFAGARRGRPTAVYPLTNALVQLHARLARANLELRSFHRLLVVHEIAPTYFENVFEAARASSATKVLWWLRRHAETQTPGASTSSGDEDRILTIARERAQRLGASEVDARDYLLAILGDPDSVTVREIRTKLGADGFARLVDAATHHVPAQYALRSAIDTLEL